jgi:hypothetical protein
MNVARSLIKFDLIERDSKPLYSSNTSFMYAVKYFESFGTMN